MKLHKILLVRPSETDSSITNVNINTLICKFVDFNIILEVVDEEEVDYIARKQNKFECIFYMVTAANGLDLIGEDVAFLRTKSYVILYDYSETGEFEYRVLDYSENKMYPQTYLDVILSDLSIEDIEYVEFEEC